MAGRLLAVSDLHVAYPQNRAIVQRLRPSSPSDWLLVAGDTGEFLADIEWALGTLSERFARVIWVPGNHDLWTHTRDPVRLRGEQRYQRLVEVCRGLGVLTPEDPFCVWEGAGGPAVADVGDPLDQHERVALVHLQYVGLAGVRGDRLQALPGPVRAELVLLVQQVVQRAVQPALQ